MTEPSLWMAVAGLALTLVGAWVRLNSQIAKMDTKALADKTACDTSMALIRAELVAVEARGSARTGQLGAQLDRIDAKVDRLLERHG